MDDNFLYQLASLLDTSVSDLTQKSLAQYRKKYAISPDTYNLACEAIAKMTLEQAITIRNLQ